MKIDLADAYIHIKLAPESQKRFTLSMHCSILLLTCLPFVISWHLVTFRRSCTSSLEICTEFPLTWTTCSLFVPMLRNISRTYSSCYNTYRIRAYTAFWRRVLSPSGHWSTWVIHCHRMAISGGQNVTAITKMPLSTNFSALCSFLAQCSFTLSSHRTFLH